MNFRILAITLLTAVSSAPAFDFISYPPVRWPAGDVPMYLELDYTSPLSLPLSDGSTSWNQVASDALGAWNAVLPLIQFAPQDSTRRLADGDDHNEVFFSPTLFGHRFGNGVLAVTTTWRVRTERVEGDTVFNENIDWDSYRGALNYDVIDFRRVAVHEFGHTVGLDHPDQAGQVVESVMNSHVSDQEDLADDDVRGARALYYEPGTRYTVNASVDPVDSGIVFISPSSPDGTYSPGTLVTLTAKPNKGFRFNYWTDGHAYSTRTIKLRIYENESFQAELTPTSAPRIASPPRSGLASDGIDVVFRVRAVGKPPLTYQWQHNGSDIPGANRPMLLLSNVTVSDAGEYSVVVSNVRGATMSKPATLLVNGKSIDAR